LYSLDGCPNYFVDISYGKSITMDFSTGKKVAAAIGVNDDLNNQDNSIMNLL